MTALRACGLCGNDRIKKVSAIAAEQTTFGQSRGSYVGGSYGHHTGTMVHGGTTSGVTHSQTQLGAWLAPPPMPRAPKQLMWTALMVWGGFCAFVIAMRSTGNSASMSAEELAAFRAVLVGIIAVWLIGSAAVAVIFSQLDARARDQNHAERARWAQAAARWETLYYCGRCDLVIDPNRNVTAHPSQIDGLL